MNVTQCMRTETACFQKCRLLYASFFLLYSFIVLEKHLFLIWKHHSLNCEQIGDFTKYVQECQDSCQYDVSFRYFVNMGTVLYWNISIYIPYFNFQLGKVALQQKCWFFKWSIRKNKNEKLTCIESNFIHRCECCNLDKSILRWCFRNFA